MDPDLLINLIKANEPLWNMRHRSYRDTHKKQKIWKEIADIMDAEEHVVRLKWNCLRSSFKREIRKLADKKRNYESQWQHMDAMMFLKDNIHPVKVLEDTDSAKPHVSYEEVLYHEKEGEPSQDFSEDSQEYVDSNPLEEELVPSEDIKIEEPIIYAPAENKSKRVKIVAHKDRLSKKIQQVSQGTKVEDEDYNFAMSIIPTLKSLPHDRKLYVRTKIQAFLYNEHINQHKIPADKEFTY